MQTKLDKINKIPSYAFALGGLEEIGKNTYIVEHDDELFIFDAGIKFSTNEMLGIRGIIPDYSYLKENEHRIKGLVITHGHEDHIGGIPHLLRQIKIPKIYVSLLPSKLIEKKLLEYPDIKVPEIIVINDHFEIKTKHFLIEFARVCHSIPDAFCVSIQTPNGRLVTTGDFRFDFATKGDMTDLTKLFEFNKKGVDVVLCESTSSEIPGFSDSERYIVNNIKNMILQSPGRVFVSTFASNLGRVQEIINLAASLNKKIIILGKSMEANVKVSYRINYLTLNQQSIIPVKDAINFNDDELVFILTGSQGEDQAALNVIARGEHSKITLKPSDTVILSSNPIPGNFLNVEKLINNLYKYGVTVIENKPWLKTHASGHATKAEQQLMIRALNPTYIFPIHGEFKMLFKLRENLGELGYDWDKILITTNGNKMKLLNHVLSKTDIYVEAQPNYLDGKNISRNSNLIIRKRNKLSNDGVIHISLILNKEGNGLMEKPVISSRGCFFVKSSIHMLNKINEKINVIVSKFNNEKSDKVINALKKEIFVVIKETVWKWKKKNPAIFVSIFDNLKTTIDIKKRTESDLKYYIDSLNKLG